MLDVPGAIAVGHRHLHRLRWHAPLSHTDHAITLIVGGRMRMNLGEAVTAGPSSVLIVPAGLPHEPVQGNGLDLWGVRFCAPCFGLDETQPLMTAFARVRRGALPVVYLPAARKRRVLRLFGDLAREIDAGLPESRDLVRSMLLLLLGEVHRAMPASPVQVDQTTFVPAALTYIQRHCLRRISLRDVAHAVGRAPAHVAATVKKSTGHTVGEWIATARLAEAVARLLHTDDSIAEIAESVGWADETHFIRQFRKTYRKTPAAWRRAHRGPHR